MSDLPPPVPSAYASSSQNGTPLAGDAETRQSGGTAQAPRPPAELRARPVADAAAPSRPASAAPAAPATTGGAAVQIGAYDTQASADLHWRQIIDAFPSEGRGKGQRIEPTETPKGRLYRTLITGFASSADAASFCASLKARGLACLPRRGG